MYLHHAMSNGVQIFVNMRIFLILLLGFIHLVVCCHHTNISEYEDVCPVTWFRRKRANMEYTRWRSNIDTTAEFIVKVLDDESLTTNTNQVVAVNILPVTKRGEKIIVGGAMVPPPKSTSGTDLPRDYTRFMLPTTPAIHDDDEVYVARITTGTIPEIDYNSPPVKPEITPPRKDVKKFYAVNNVGRNAVRDESPPASPQFVPHMPPVASARQYAPIAPVAFSPRSTISPLTPPLQYDRFMYSLHPTRSSPPDPIVLPTRTSVDEVPFFQAFMDDVGNEHGTFVTRTPHSGPDRTTTIGLTAEAPFLEDEFHATKLQTEIKVDEFEGDRRSMKDGDFNYNNMFVYNEDDKDINSKRVMDYDDKSHLHEESEMHEKDSLETTTVDNVPTYDLVERDNKTADLPTYSDNSIDKEEENVTDEDISTEELKGTAINLPSDTPPKKETRPICSLTKLRHLDFNSPRTLPEIIAQLKQWTEESPVARWTDITGGNLTTMENPIYMMIIDDPSVGQVVSEKQIVLIIAGIQGRDHYAVAAAMYILYQFIERSEAHSDLLGKYRFWIIPVFNPDGYDYSMTFPHRREWVKNLHQGWDNCKDSESCRYCGSHGLRCTISPCYGVNLDRNFEYQWIPHGELRDNEPCGNLYAGSRQLSEAETRALSIYLHQNQAPIAVFLALKEGDICGVLYPFSHTKKKRANDALYRHRALTAATAAFSIAGRTYYAGQTSEYLPLYAGGIEDWADGHLGIDNAYSILLFRLAEYRGYSREVSEYAVHEAYAAMDALLVAQPPRVILMREHGPRLVSSCTMVLFATFVSFLYSLYKNSVT